MRVLLQATHLIRKRSEDKSNVTASRSFDVTEIVKDAHAREEYNQHTLNIELQYTTYR